MKRDDAQGSPCIVEAAPVDDDTAHYILHAPADMDVDRVVMGTHGRHGFRRLVLANACTRARHTTALTLSGWLTDCRCDRFKSAEAVECTASMAAQRLSLCGSCALAKLTEINLPHTPHSSKTCPSCGPASSLASSVAPISCSHWPARPESPRWTCYLPAARYGRRSCMN